MPETATERVAESRDAGLRGEPSDARLREEELRATSPPALADAATDITPAAPPGGWWDARWRSRRRVQIASAPAQRLEGFRLLLMLDLTRFDYARAEPDGRDLRFVDGHGVVLPHEVDTWAPRGRSFIWVRLPAFGGDASGDLWLYHGNPEALAPTAAEARAVWAGAFVWHLGDGRESGAGLSEARPSGATFGEGRIGGAVVLDGARRHRVGLPTAAYLAGAAHLTISGWMLATAFAATDDKFGRTCALGIARDPAIDRNSNHAALSLCFANGSGAPSVAVHLTGDEITVRPAQGAFQPGAWEHFAATVDLAARKVAFFRNGVPLGEPRTASFDAPVFKDAMSFGHIGASSGGGYAFFTGRLDEVRLERGLRSPVWIRAEHDNASAPDTFVRLGPEEQGPGR